MPRVFSDWKLLDQQELSEDNLDNKVQHRQQNFKLQLSISATMWKVRLS